MSPAWLKTLACVLAFFAACMPQRRVLECRSVLHAPGTPATADGTLPFLPPAAATGLLEVENDAVLGIDGRDGMPVNLWGDGAGVLLRKDPGRTRRLEVTRFGRIGLWRLPFARGPPGVG
ncbi:MAG TPA: hypothetical protein VGA56_17165 [Opitutaceae bacterium]